MSSNINEILGQGASQAIEDGYTLGVILGAASRSRNPDVKKWLEVYEQIRMPRAEAVGAASRYTGKVMEEHLLTPTAIDWYKKSYAWIYTGEPLIGSENIVKAVFGSESPELADFKAVLEEHPCRPWTEDMSSFNSPPSKFMNICT